MTTQQNGFSSNFTKLVQQSREQKALLGIAALISWDQETYLPSAGVQARAAQSSALSGIIHDMFTAPAFSESILWAQEFIQEHPDQCTPDDRSLLRVMLREHERMRRLPRSLVQALADHTVLSLGAWKDARDKHDATSFIPALQRMVELKQEVASSIGTQARAYDTLLDEYEEGLTSAAVQAAFAPIKSRLLPQIPLWTTKTAVFDKAVFHQHFDSEKLWNLTMQLLPTIGFDLTRGRQDRSAHPFTIGIDRSDVRLTTRVLETNPLSTILSTIHEAGHGLYEQGIDSAIADTRLGVTDSLVIHESQSRLYENMIGKSKEFWSYFFPIVAESFPEQLGTLRPEDVWREVTIVRPGPIRVDADEVTYHAHILIRFEIEEALIAGDIAVKDVAHIWNERYKEYLGLSITDDAQGVLQDIHWAQGLIGYFPTYSLGSMLAAELFSKLLLDHPEISDQIAMGSLGTVKEWLGQTVHRHGSRFSSAQLLSTVTGKQMLTADALIDYLEKKYQMNA